MTIAEHAAKVMNEALEADRTAMQKLLDVGVEVNPKLADHPEIQCHQNTDTSPVVLRLMGVLNGILLRNNPGEVLVQHTDDDDKTVRFSAMPSNSFNRKGFTLVELLVVMAFVGFAAVIVGAVLYLAHH